MTAQQSMDDKALFAYEPPLGVFDEMQSADGEVYPHWQYMVQALQSLGSNELEGRRLEALRLLREYGVTYNVYSEAGSDNRPWQLDPVPVLFSSETWAELEAGLIQRVNLLNLILEDLYGPRELIRKGLLPLELIYNHGGFLRPCDGIRQAGHKALLLYAADIGRGPDGRMWVLSDRTQAPSGAGYALENRTVTARVVPSLFRDSHVHRLAGFFHALRNTLANITPHDRDDPHIVVLTPGPHNETYFEHAYLAAYLGYPLVQGDNLTVQNGVVYLKSVDGLKPVDVILRRVDDHYCDPVELRADSQLGVPGLLEAVRRGNVTIANPLGSSVLENPGFMAYLPGIAEHLLGQPLQLPSTPTWWCGDAKACQYVIDNLPQLVIKPIYRQAGSRLVFGSSLSKKELDEWRARIRARPALYVGQEQISLSLAPALIDGQLQPRHMLFRSFLVARDDDYLVMPGGLTRTASALDDYLVSNQTGSTSKDTWVLATEPERQISLWPQVSAGQPLHRNGVLPSRAADNLFWVGRYAERAEDTARVLRIVLQQLNENEEFRDAIGHDVLAILLRAVTHVTASYPGFLGDDAEQRLAQPEPYLLEIINSAQINGSLVATLQHLAQTAYAVRDRWSTDSWRVIDDISEITNSFAAAGAISINQLEEQLDNLLTVLIAFSGLAMESMTRNHGWRFLDIGRRLERGMQLIALLRSTMVWQQPEAVESLVLENILSTSESLITYRRRYRTWLDFATVVDLLIFDTSNPRSLIYQLERMQQLIGELPNAQLKDQLNREGRLVLEATTQIRLADAAQLTQFTAEAGMATELDQLLARIFNLLTETSAAITDAYFSHTEGPQPLDPGSMGG